MLLIDHKLFALLIFVIVLMTVTSIPDDAKMGEIYFKSFQHDKALDHYKKAKALDSNSPKIIKQLKNYYLVQGDVASALLMQEKVCLVLTRNITELKELVQLYEWNNQPYEALKTQERIIPLLDGDNKAELLHHLTQGYRWLRYYDDADRVASYLDQSDKIDYLISDLEYYVSRSNFPKVIELTNRLNALGIDSPKFRLLQAQSFEIQSDIRNAIVGYKKYLGGDPSNHNYGSYKIVRSEKFYKDNLRTFEKLITLYQELEDDDYLVMLYAEIFQKVPSEYEIGLSAAVMLYEREEYQKVRSILHKIIHSNLARDVYRSGDMLLLLNDNKNARKHLEKAYQIDPTNVETMEALSEAYERLGLNKKALRLQYRIRKLIKTKIPHQSWHPAFGATSYYQVQATGPSDISQLNAPERLKTTQKRIIFLLEKVGDRKSKLAELENYARTYPLDVEMLLELAFAYADINQVSNARKIFEQILAINPYHEKAITSLAEYYWNNGEKGMARTLMERLSNENLNEQTLNRLELIYHDSDDVRAGEICEKFLNRKLKSTDSFAAYELKSRCLIRNDRYGEASDIMLDYLEENPNEKSAKELLGYYLAESGKSIEAKIIARDIGNETLYKYADYLEFAKRRAQAWMLEWSYSASARSMNWVSYSDAFLNVIKYNNEWFYGFGTQAGESYYRDGLYSSGYLIFGKNKPNQYNYRFELGKNISYDRDFAGKAKIQIPISKTQDELSFFLEYNQTLNNYSFPNSNQSLTLDKLGGSYEWKRPFAQFIVLPSLIRYNITNPHQKNLYASIYSQYLYRLKQLYLGGLLEHQQRVQKNEYFNSRLSDRSSVACLKAAYQFQDIEVDDSYDNRIEVCGGYVLSRPNNDGFYGAIENVMRIKHGSYSFLELRARYDQFVFENRENVLSLGIYQQIWFF